MCPRCQCQRLRRQLSTFNLNRRQDRPANLIAESNQRTDMIGAQLATTAEHDTHATAALASELYQACNVQPGEAMREVLSRIEAGHDPAVIEADLGDAIHCEDESPMPSAAPQKDSTSGHEVPQPPLIDPVLYEL